MSTSSSIRIELLNEKLFDEPPLLYPDGISAVEIPFKVTNTQTGDPIPNAKITFSVEFIRPNGADTRTEQGIVDQYREASTKEEIRRRIRSGEIKLIGTINTNEASTDAQGVAKVTYVASHIGGNQVEIGQEKVIATLESNGQVVPCIINVGFDFLVPIPTIDKGVRIINSKGKHIHKDLAPLFEILGEEIKNSNWPVPMTISAGTLTWGGLYPPHKAHRWGAEFDVWTIATDGLQPYKFTEPQYDRAKTQILVDKLIKYGATKIFFNDPNINGVKYETGHDDHLHVSFAKNNFKEGLTLHNLDSND